MRKFKIISGDTQDIPETSFEAFLLDLKNPKPSIFHVLKQWLYCSWIHRHWKCYPRVDVPKPCEIWHCSYCHSCAEGMYALLGEPEIEKEQAIKTRKHLDDLVKKGLVPHWWQK